MTSPLAPCPSCSRHVKTSEASCPFCKCDLEAGELVAVPGTTRRMTRAAAYAFTASLVVAGCAGSTTSTGDGGAADGGSGADGASDGGKDARADVGAVQPPYGAPAYGAPPPDDGG